MLTKLKNDILIEISKIIPLDAMVIVDLKVEAWGANDSALVVDMDLNLQGRKDVRQITFPIHSRHPWGEMEKIIEEYKDIIMEGVLQRVNVFLNEMPMKAEMQYFYFTLPYMALIKATNIKEAISEYTRTICDIEESCEVNVERVSGAKALRLMLDGIDRDVDDIISDFRNPEIPLLLVDSGL